MTLHDKLKEILEKHEYEALLHDKFAIIPDPAPSTIAAIIQAVAERLPGERDEPKIIHDWDFGHEAGWNAYREEVRKVLSPLEIDTGDGFKPVSVDRGSFGSINHKRTANGHEPMQEVITGKNGEINYKELLRKYIEHVVDCEGVDFIFKGNGSRENPFTEQEWKELERMAGGLR